MAKRIRLKEVEAVEFRPGEFLKEFARQNWTAEEFGCYCLIIFALYDEGGKLPNEPAVLAAICRMSELEFVKIWERIAIKYSRHGSLVSHKRVQSELQKSRKRMQTYRDKAVAAAQSRWLGHSSSNAARIESSQSQKSSLIDIDKVNKKGILTSDELLKIEQDRTLYTQKITKVFPLATRHEDKFFAKALRVLTELELNSKPGIFKDAVGWLCEIESNRQIKNRTAYFRKVLRDKTGVQI